MGKHVSDFAGGPCGNQDNQMIHQQALCHLWSPALQEVDEGSERDVGFLSQPGNLETRELKAESKARKACSQSEGQ